VSQSVLNGLIDAADAASRCAAVYSKQPDRALLGCDLPTDGRTCSARRGRARLAATRQSVAVLHDAGAQCRQM